jgi:magnesium and cobalt exporter, CNNM family
VSLTVWLGVVAMLLANALYVAAEFGAVGVRRSRVRRLSDDGHLLARRLLPFVENPVALDRYVGASQIGITISSLMLGAFANATIAVALAPVLARSFELEADNAQTAAAIVVLAALTALQVVIGELVPKALALQHPTQTALATVLPMQWSLRMFRPFIAFLNGTSTILLRVLGSRVKSHRHLHSPEEIEMFIAASRDGGLLEPDEHRRLRRALRLSRRTARDLMVPLNRLSMLSIDTPWDAVVAEAAASPFSRLPVYRGARERIVGTLRVKDLVERYVAQGPGPLEQLIRPVIHIPASAPGDRIIGLLRERRAHQAVVVDEQSLAIGLVTIQDVLSELMATTAGHA